MTGSVAGMSASANGYCAAAAGMFATGSGEKENDIVLEIREGITGKISVSVVTYSLASGAPVYAYGLAAKDKNGKSGKILVMGNVSKSVTSAVTTKKKTESSADAYCMYATDELRVTGTVANITASLSGEYKVSSAFGFYSSKGSVILGGVEGNITAKNEKATQGKAAAIYAYGDKSGKLKSVSIQGDINGKITSKSSVQRSSASYGIYAVYGSISLSGMVKKDVSITAKAATDFSYASGFEAETYVKIKTVKGNVTCSATNSGDTATANGIRTYEGDILVDGDIAGKMTIKSSGGKSSTANGIYAGGNLTVKGAIAKGITTNATAGKENFATADCISAEKIMLMSGINCAISATASGNSANAYGMQTFNDACLVSGDMKGKMTITATANAGKASANGLLVRGNLTVKGKLAAPIQVKATSKINSVDAYCVYADDNISLDGISGKLSVTAKAAEFVSAAAISGSKSLTVNGDISSNISVTASGKSGEVCAIQTGADMTVYGNITGKISLSAQHAHACIMHVGGSLSVKENLGTLVCSTSDSSCEGCFIGGNVIAESGVLKGKITATSVGAPAIGMYVGGKFLNGDGKENVTAILKVNVAGSECVGIGLENSVKLTLKDSSVTAKKNGKLPGNADGLCYSICGSLEVDTVQNLTLDKTTLTGNVSLGGGDDYLELNNGSKIKGDVDMGTGSDRLFIYSGSQIKGSILNATDVWLDLDKTKVAKTPMWEGADFNCTNLRLEIENIVLSSLNKTGKSQTFNLLKDTSAPAWQGQRVELYVNDCEYCDTLYCDGNEYNWNDDYSFKLSSSKDGKTMQLTIRKL